MASAFSCAACAPWQEFGWKCRHADPGAEPPHGDEMPEREERSVRQRVATATVEEHMGGASGSWAIVVAPGLAAQNTEPEVRFRVGPAKYGYDYQRAPSLTLGGCPVYKCARGRDHDARPLYIYFDGPSSAWHAVSVAGLVTSAQDLLARGTPAFRCAVVGDDVRQPGPHFWECYDDRRGAWWPASSFSTTLL
jgi:hypothetical protein